MQKSIFHKTIFTWFFYHLPERRYYQLSYKIQDNELININSCIIDKLHVLNENRISLTNKISALCSNSNECIKCEVNCCRGNYDHFTALDFILRFNSNTPIYQFGKLIQLESLPFTLYKKIKGLLSVENKHFINRRISKKEINCHYLTKYGCSLLPEERPIRCLLWTCRKFRNSLDYDTFIELGLRINELSAIGTQAYKLYHLQRSMIPPNSNITFR